MPWVKEPRPQSCKQSSFLPQRRKVRRVRSIFRSKTLYSVPSAVVRKNRIFEIQINLARQCLFHSEKITALNPLCHCERLELLTGCSARRLPLLHDLFLLL